MQLYSVVLGLDVLGNPAGFIRGVAGGTRGIFYYPFEVVRCLFQQLHSSPLPYRVQYWDLESSLKVSHWEAENS